MSGKNKCKILKDIRRRIAEENDIELITSECTYKGECRGTCPKCEAEVRQLEKELKRRAAIGAAVTVAGVAVSVALISKGCSYAHDAINDKLNELFDDGAVTKGVIEAVPVAEIDRQNSETADLYEDGDINI